jgi:hypothetical protein
MQWYVVSPHHCYIPCPFTRLVWGVVHFIYNIPHTVTNMFSNWLNGIYKKTKARIHVWVYALVWVIRNSGKDVVFNIVVKPSLLQVIHMLSSSIQMWSYRRSTEQRGPRLMAVVHVIFSQVAGCILDIYKMRRSYLCVLFIWMVFTDTLSDPWVVRLLLWPPNNIKVVHIASMQWSEQCSHFEKKAFKKYLQKNLTYKPKPPNMEKSTTH